MRLYDVDQNDSTNLNKDEDNGALRLIIHATGHKTVAGKVFRFQNYKEIHYGSIPTHVYCNHYVSVFSYTHFGVCLKDMTRGIQNTLTHLLKYGVLTEVEIREGGLTEDMRGTKLTSNLM